jgi:hypothetical protein
MMLQDYCVCTELLMQREEMPRRMSPAIAVP